jgi:hypothetical protein
VCEEEWMVIEELGRSTSPLIWHGQVGLTSI